jgi:protein OS-9
MTMTDSIMFVKETKTCHYILVINTPRLCGEPGFKSRVDQHEEALIRCREVVDAATLANADNQQPESDHPYRQRRTPTSSNSPPPLDAAEDDGSSHDDSDAEPGANDAADALNNNDLLRRALETILQKATGNAGAGNGASGGGGAEPRVVVEDVGDGEMVIEFISEVDDREDVERSVDDLSRLMDSGMFEDALRAAGFDVRDEGVEVEVEVDAEGDEERQQNDRTLKGSAKGRRRANARHDRDEL